MSKEVLYWIQPRAILSIEKHVRLHQSASLKHLTVVMEGRIVHQNHYRLLLSAWI